MNLLVSLDALLSERSVSGAARKMGLSQPALSASLARLRRHFDDQLLERQGNSYLLTPLAQRLEEQVHAVLHSARRVFEAQGLWDPATSEREFLIYGSDYAISSIGRRVAALSAAEAPGVSFRFELNTPRIVEDAAEHLRLADGLLIPHGHVEDLHAVELGDDEWVIIADAEHPTLGQELRLEDLEENPWVVTFNSKTSSTAAHQQLQAMGIERRIEISIQSFLSVPHFVVGTRRLGLIQRSLAQTSSLAAQLQIFRAPFDLMPVKNALWWHPVNAADPGHMWLRELFARAVQ